MKKVYAVFPSPFIVLSMAEFVYRNGQIQASVTIKRPAVSLWKRKRPIKDPNRRKKRQQARPRMKQLPAVLRIRLTISERFPAACFSATAGISIVQTEVVTAEGKRTHGRAIPVSTP